MVEEKKIPRGYKKTEAGVIPEEWEIKRIGDLLEVHYGKDQRSVKDENGTYPILGSGGQIGWSNEYLYDKESVLIGRKGTIDRPQHTEKPFWTIDTLFYTKIFGNINPKYIYYLFKTINWRSYNEATGVPSLNTTTVESIRVASPPFPEQLAIAEVLSDVDDLINSIESLIDKKQKIKQGAMQELLTGKRRLPGFSGEWERKRLGDMGNTYSGLRGKTKKDFCGGNCPYIPFLNVIYNNIINVNSFQYVKVGSSESQNKALKGDLFFNTSSETPEEVGMCAVLLDNIENLYLNSFCFGYRLHKDSQSDPLFLTYLIRSDYGRKLFYSLAQGATRHNLSKNHFNNLEVLLPGMEEQQAIAQILSDMDYEIETLEEKLKKYRALKQGMMQELLTGRIRLL